MPVSNTPMDIKLLGAIILGDVVQFDTCPALIIKIQVTPVTRYTLT